MNTYLTRWLTRRLAPISASLFLVTLAAHSQTLIRGEFQDDFKSLGIDAHGVAFAVGDDEFRRPFLFQFTRTGVIRMPLKTLPDASQTEAIRISRDARYIVGSYTTIDGSEEGVIWDRRQLGSPISLGALEGIQSYYPRDVASRTDGPFVIGRAGPGSFLWTASTGIRMWVTNKDYPPLLQLERTSSDGNRLVGNEFSLVGTNVKVGPFVGTETNYVLLDARRSLLSEVFGISPNGTLVCGHVERQSALWDETKLQLLPFRADLHGLFCVSDNGFAGGRSSLGAIIHDARGRKLELFDDWWAKNYPEVPLRVSTRSVEDIQESGDQVYCLLTAVDNETLEKVSLLAIAPLKGKKQPMPGK